MNSPFTTEEVLSKAKRLSAKYRGNSNKEDLQQEALLAYYEALDKGITDQGRLITEMRKAMYHSVKTQDKPTKLPKGGNIYRLTKELPKEEFDKLNETQKRIYLALQENMIDFDEVAEMLSSKAIPVEAAVAVRQVFDTVLTAKEQLIVVGVVLQEKTVREMAKELDTSYQWVHKVKEDALDKLKEALDV